MVGRSVERALRIWQARGLLSEEQADTFRRALADEAAAAGSRRGIVVFSLIGAVLVGVGVMLFIGSNWERLGPAARVTLVFAGYAAVCVAAWGAGRRGLPRVEEALWFLVTLLLGGAIFLLAQIFNFSLTYWQGPLLWMLGTVAMGHARRQAIYAVLALPLAVLTLGWLGGGRGWFMDDQLEFLANERGLSAVSGLIGVGFISLGLLVQHSARWAFAARSLAGCGSIIVVAVLVASSAHHGAAARLFELVFTPKQIVIIAACVALAAAAVASGRACRDLRAVLAGVTLLLLLLVVPFAGKPALGALFDRHLAAFAVYVVFVFGLSIATVWVGVHAGNRHLVNVGIVSCSIIILIQYFSWSFDMLPTALAFILGGIVLLVLSLAMERARRSMIARLGAGA